MAFYGDRYLEGIMNGLDVRVILRCVFKDVNNASVGREKTVIV